jgi:hypothetical protein
MNTIRARMAEYKPNFLALKSSTDLGYRALQTKDYDKAAWHLEFEVENSPMAPEPRLYLGQVYEETGQTEKAAAMYKSATQLDAGLLVAQDSTAQGRPVTEVAAERLAALKGTREVAAVAEQMAVANTPPEMRPADDITDGAKGPNIFPDDVQAQPPLTPPADPQTTEAAEPAQAPETVVVNAALEPVAQPAPAPVPEPVKAFAAAPTPPANTTAIHLASYKRRSDADRGWSVLTNKHPDLRSYEPAVIEADLGPKKGIYYRLVADGIGSRGQARDLCRTLKTQGHDWCQIGKMSH